MHLKNWKRGFGLALLTAFFSCALTHCGVDGNPFYLTLRPTPRLGDVPDAREGDSSLDDALTDDDVVSPDVPVDDGSVAPDIVTVDVTDGGLITSDQLDDIVVIVDADLADMIDAAIAPDVVPVADVIDAGVGPDAVDVVTVTDVVDVVVPQDRPDVVMGTDVQDVVMPQDRPDAVMVTDTPDVIMPDTVDVPTGVDAVDAAVSPDVPTIPDFVVEYISVNGGDVVPSSTGGNVSNLSIAFFESGAWVWRSYPATRFTRDGSSNWYRVTIDSLTPAQRSTPRVLLSIVNGCGLDTGGDCPSRWWSQWQTIWFGTTYSGSSWFTNENRVTCRDFGGFNQGCVTFARP